MLQTRHDAYQLLAALGASDRLLLHVHLVGEAAAMLMKAYTQLGMRYDARLIELGVAIHDAGKIQYPAELDAPGSRHEPAGQTLLLAHGVDPEVARCCVSHAAWQAAGVSFEEKSVALADKLWKGKREEALELSIIDEIASRLHVDRWDVYTQLDAVFEDIAAGGADRLSRSRIA
ncbi:hypothetical protein ACFQUU_01970 [Herbaspirillum sp. GCM10030257]|uniref:hypothetical protein n=1 Tax=Herbaspirillum sp. GCM10030257 TaxID=3273393 RepID=UPI003613295A